jgi:hypothetical protein
MNKGDLCVVMSGASVAGVGAAAYTMIAYGPTLVVIVDKFNTSANVEAGVVLTQNGLGVAFLHSLMTVQSPW